MHNLWNPGRARVWGAMLRSGVPSTAQWARNVQTMHVPCVPCRRGAEQRRARAGAMKEAQPNIHISTTGLVFSIYVYFTRALGASTGRLYK